MAMAIFLTHSSPSIFQRFLLIIILLALYAASSLSFSQTISSTDAICDLTPHPEFCKSLLPRNNSTNINDLGRLSLRLALSTSRNSLNRLNSYFKSNESSIRTTLYVLRDCRFLLRLNTHFLSDVLRSIKSANRLPESAAGDAQSLLSAVMSNQQTCWDQLVTTPSASNISAEFSPSLSNGSLLYSVSLALFKLGWLAGVPRNLIGRRDLAVFGEKYVKVREAVVVNPDGTGDYSTVSAAVAAAPKNGEAGGGYYVIRVAAGVYEEYVKIGSSKKYVMMIGEGINKTIITGNRSVVDGWTTFGCATFGLSGEGFVAINMTFRNTAGAMKHQAVAVRNNADFSAFYKCSFEAYQDTLFTHSLRQFYRECDVYGTVDFIFGNAAAVLQSCNIYPRLPMPGQFNAVTAQGRTDVNQNTGASFHNCTVAAAADLAAAGNRSSTRTFLGRPWKERSRTVFMQTFLGGLISPAGWSLWIGDFALTTLFYAEYENTGPGSNTTGRVTWPGYHRAINRTDAVQYTVSNFIAGNRWIPATGVPYAAGLL
ncbi:PREDICTED: probable pectinesterase/pectinesterase inhibitor 7 [Ipomoea nil]|uniref:probable pectinesterase/pectinesterase inhibitor 7 n=1 Tax=Ipomoea nil TaxID=35883 RepID=UPI000900B3E1|nr:PREDICTED: probable pectinesterase/pectinesterase inhibitor 7 [Ipomoea nil]